ncbi:hypothetical protein KCU99_g2425, partial [Aureobasidium melanogenum]
MKPSTLTGMSAAITGAVATSGVSSTTTSTASNSAGCTSLPEYNPFNSTEDEIIAIHSSDKVFVSLGDTEHCVNATFDGESRLFYDTCYPFDASEFKSLSTRVTFGTAAHLVDHRCVLAAFDDDACAEDGAIITNLKETRGSECTFEQGLETGPYQSLKFVCDDMIDDGWEDLTEPDTISARSVDAELSSDHVTVAPADGPNCNSVMHRDTDTKLQGHCHSFKKPFLSLSASIKERADKSAIGGSQPCSVLVFSDNKCKKDGAEIVDLNNTAALGVCHNITLHHGNDLVTPIAGHSWKWVCGRQQINECLNGAIDSGTDTDTDTDTDTETSTVKKGKTFTVTATTSLACSLTTEAAHSVDVVTSVITHKPVTHTITSVFTKTQLRVRTKLITSVATAVSTVHHTLTKPFSTTYKVCDAEASRQS